MGWNFWETWLGGKCILRVEEIWVIGSQLADFNRCVSKMTPNFLYQEFDVDIFFLVVGGQWLFGVLQKLIWQANYNLDSDIMFWFIFQGGVSNFSWIFKVFILYFTRMNLECFSVHPWN